MNKMLKLTLPLLLIFLLASALGCSAAREEPMVSAPIDMPLPPAPESAPAALMQETAKGSADYYAEPSAVEVPGEANIERRIVRTGYLTLEVEDTGQIIEEISDIAVELGGYVVSSNKRVREDTVRGTISIRVPVERFDEALVSIRKLAVEVSSESTQGIDVTEEYTDLQAQLRNLEATEAQYLELLKKAETVEDILKVQAALSNVRGEIERIKGRIQYLERTSDTALIEVSLQETKAVGENGWNAAKTFKAAINGLITFGKVLASVLIWVVIFIPVWGLITFLVIFFRRRHKAKAKTS